MSLLAEAGAELLGGVLVSESVLHGGDISQLAHITLDDGREAVVKNGPSPRTEAAMLAAISESGAPAPAVLAADEHALVMEVLPDSGSLRNAWADLGIALATLHARRDGKYGWSEDYAFGPVAIVNDRAEDWIAFWGDERLLVNVPHIDGRLARRIERLVADLPNRIPARPAAALLHGDMWGGNIVVSDNRVSGLIDPACYFGHCEVDLAMLNLFGRPGDAFYDAYGALEPGYEERLTIYQLWPALVHLRLFGGGYRPMVEGLLQQLGV
ncbi:fructosamine kinase family protein [Afifella marina]|uniref:Fructosamine-3-kinase n=1 Tax=Afifella marina DSM 2698 TaxID=1120955 RepID=A0A1G5PAQ6_AFIMA|nr:fructosamine kinase family protein [Afifella marina]MBK1625437.1 aminoglycoside phosphotransferase [Afifella marina DSM 2698]MBK1629056.1 aminoglycoside phosphotransferase [Afifella marina]MBK5918095.1 aminoglycoside phosphotransferase [Afifella marina]RAI17516.1 aminoglycoside phosphotransferase [Afifella marina DSM 2698]SCZ46378.1 Fructosamine-3-kinase [Afifella marina DSM 2698]